MGLWGYRGNVSEDSLIIVAEGIKKKLITLDDDG
jgi:hypothetical protein